MRHRLGYFGRWKILPSLSESLLSIVGTSTPSVDLHKILVLDLSIGSGVSDIGIHISDDFCTLDNLETKLCPGWCSCLTLHLRGELSSLCNDAPLLRGDAFLLAVDVSFCTELFKLEVLCPVVEP